MEKASWIDSVRTEAHFLEVLLLKHPKKCMIDTSTVHFLGYIDVAIVFFFSFCDEKFHFIQ